MRRPHKARRIISGRESYVSWIFISLFVNWTRKTAQTTNGETEKGLSDTYKDYHDYTVSLTNMSFVARSTGDSSRLTGNRTPFPGSSMAKMSARSKHRVLKMAVWTSSRLRRAGYKCHYGLLELTARQLALSRGLEVRTNLFWMFNHLMLPLSIGRYD